ncbi:hypothetical protein LguiA_016524 [Lonicera macranthoides]
MEIEATGGLLKKGENFSQGSMKNKLDYSGLVIKSDDVLVVPCSSPPVMIPANGGASLDPITPDSNREIGDFPFDFKSPLTLVSLPPKSSQGKEDPCSSNEHSPCTPKEGVFDPFAPGPDKLMMAPLRTKCLDESQSYVARRLNFNSSVKFGGDLKCENDAGTISDEEMLLETVYDSLLEAIISKQTETFLAEISSLDPSPDGFETPPYAPRFSGIAETCPDAPVKRTAKSRNIDSTLCRKLEF